MGKLVYGLGNLEVEIEDRVLAHLQIVVTAKLRRNEGFMLSWADEPGAGNGRSSIWIHQAIPLHFSYDTNEQPEINRQWLEQLTVSASNASGMRLVEEPASA